MTNTTYLLQPRANIEVSVDDHDNFGTVIYSAIPNDRDFLKCHCALEADSITSAVQACMWEALFHAVPILKQASIGLTIECATHIVTYNKNMHFDKSAFKEWSPELHNCIMETSRILKGDIANMLLDLATTFYWPSTVQRKGNVPYDIRRRG